MIIRRAEPGDEAELTAMIHELAEFERAGHECTVTETQLRTALFGDAPTVHGHIAEVDGQAAAGALWFRNFSTWDGVAGIYLEDLFVRPQFRRRGLARAMLATLARECVENGYTRLSWAVLDWNVDAIALYDAVGGRQHERVDHLSGVGPGVVGAGGAGVRPERSSHCTADGLNSSTSVTSATMPTRYAVDPLLRADGEVPGHRQQQQLREHRNAAAPPAARPQRPARREHAAADDREPAPRCRTCSGRARRRRRGRSRRRRPQPASPRCPRQPRSRPRDAPPSAHGDFDRSSSYGTDATTMRRRRTSQVW